MNSRAARWAAVVALGYCGALPAPAHHSGYMYQTTPIWISGTVVRFERINPHTIITLEDRAADGRLLRWAVEGPGQTQLERRGASSQVPKVGDTLEFCAFPYRTPAELASLFPGVDFAARRAARSSDGGAAEYVAGHVMITAEGQERLWEPHGFIAECMRASSDRQQAWLAFLNSSSDVRNAWCEQRRYAHVQSTPALRDFVDSVNSSIDSPCE